MAKFFERRRHARIKKSLALRIKDDKTDLITETEDISCAGAYCKIDRYIPPLSKLKVTLLIPRVEKNKKEANHKIECEGIVVRTEVSKNGNPLKDYQVAIFFNHIQVKDSQKIADYVNWHLKGKKN